MARALVLGNSIKEFIPGAEFYIIIADKPQDVINYNELEFNILFLEDIEPDAERLWHRYNTIELATSIKPACFQYLFNKTGTNTIIFFDPDIQVFNYPDLIYQSFKHFDILLTPHILTPIPLDKCWPQEFAFHPVGIYNLGFLGVKKTANSIAFLQWWKERTYEYGYNDTPSGMFTDQVFIIHVPLLFEKVYVIKDFGYNMAPWNLHERFLTLEDGNLIVNNLFPLTFYHFSTFDAGKIELPVRKYNRFTINDRPDLVQLYEQYNSNINENGEEIYASLNPAYEEQRIERIMNYKNDAHQKRTNKQKMFLKLVSFLPQGFKKKVVFFIDADLKKNTAE